MPTLAGVRLQCGATAKDYVATITQTLQDCASKATEDPLSNRLSCKRLSAL